MHELWYDYIKPNYGNRAKLCYTDTNNLVIYIETEDFYGDIANDVEKWFDTSNFDENDQGDKQVEALKDLKPIEGKLIINQILHIYLTIQLMKEKVQ